jgi:hypothetical protein
VPAPPNGVPDPLRWIRTRRMRRHAVCVVAGALFAPHGGVD